MQVKLKMIRKSLIPLICGFVLFCSVFALFAETIVFKSGKTIEADITEKTDKFIKVDFQGVVLTYYLEEIEDILKGDSKEKGSSSATIVRLPANKENNKKSFLWKLNSGSSSIYILGSIHYVNKEIYPLDKTIEKAFDESDILVVEVKADLNSMAASQLLLAQKALYIEGDSLNDHVSGRVYDLFVRTLKKLNLPAEVFVMYKPWFVSMLLTSMQLQNAGFLPQYGIDAHFIAKAEGKKSILELESVEYQVDILSNFSDSQQELFLYMTLLDLDRINEDIPRLISVWSKGDTKAVERVLFESLREDERLLPIYEILMYERNRNMAKKIEEFSVTGKKYFVVVGAGHLVGKGGIIDLLESKGCSLEQL